MNLKCKVSLLPRALLALATALAGLTSYGWQVIKEKSEKIVSWKVRNQL